MSEVSLNVTGYGRSSSHARATEGLKVAVRAWRDGTLGFAEFRDIMAMEGRVFAANFGTVATQLTFLAQAANRPDWWVRVPSGTVVIPIFFSVSLGAFAGTVTTVSSRIAQNDIGNGTSSAASIGPLSTNTAAPITALTTARQLATGDTTAETNPLEIYKQTINTANAAGNDAAGTIRVKRDEMCNPILVGPGTWEGFIWATTTQATGYVVASWIELPTSDYYS